MVPNMWYTQSVYIIQAITGSQRWEESKWLWNPYLLGAAKVATDQRGYITPAFGGSKSGEESKWL